MNPRETDRSAGSTQVRTHLFIHHVLSCSYLPDDIITACLMMSSASRRRCRWWRRFSSELICIRSIQKKVEKQPEQQQDSEVEPQSQDKRANKRAWPKFRKSRNSSYQQREEVQGEAQKKLHRFFIRGRNRRPQEDMVAVGVAQTDTVQATVIVETSMEAAQD